MADNTQNERNACGFIKERLGTVGGQAVLEGVMMKSKDKIAAYKAIADILSMTSAERGTMGRRGRNYVEENFNRETVVRRYREVVENME